MELLKQFLMDVFANKTHDAISKVLNLVAPL